MLLKFARMIGLSVAVLAFAKAGFAQGANVTTGSASAKLGGEFRSELNYHDHGLEKRDGYTPDKTTEIQVQAANVKLDGKINNDTEFAFRFNLLNPAATGGPLDYGYGTHWFSKMMGFSIGKMKVMQGGWDHWDASYRDHAGDHAVYRKNLVYSSYDEAVTVHLNVAGKVALQLLNDVTTATGGEWNKTAHPTWVLGWMGEFGGIHPLVFLGSYDNNKSRWIDIGVKTAMAGLNATLDYHMNTFTHKDPDPDDAKKNKENADNASSITLKVGYEIKNTATPWFYFSTYDNKQADDKDSGREDIKFNSSTTDAAGMTTYNWDDNGVVWGLGADLAMMGKGWNPYVAIVNRSGKFQKATDPTKEESKSEMWFRIGVLGEI